MNMRALIGKALPIPPATELFHQMQIMDRTGHTTMTWDPNDAGRVRDARNEFARLLRDGYQAFKMNVVMENGVIVEEKGDRSTTFDPTVGKYMMIPHLVGG